MQQSAFLTLLLLILSASTTFVYASSSHAKSHHSHGSAHVLPRRAQRDSDYIHVPLTRNAELEKRDVEPLQLISAQISGLSRKYGKNIAAFRQNHPGHVNPDINGTVVKVPALDVADVLTNLSLPNIRQAAEGLLGRSTSGTASLKPTSGYGTWIGSISVGTPGVAVPVAFDTGSADFVLNLNQGYDPAKSTSAKNTGKNFSVRYADQTGEGGKIYNESVVLAGKRAKGQAVGVPSWSSFAASDPGIVGMAFQSVSSFNRRPLLQTLRRYDSIPRAMFGVALSRTASKAEIRIGGYNPKKVKSGSSMNWVPIDNSGGFWTVASSKLKMAFNSKSGSLTNRKLILDTGTTLIYGSTSDVRVSTGQWRGPSATLSPPLTLLTLRPRSVPLCRQRHRGLQPRRLHCRNLLWQHPSHDDLQHRWSGLHLERRCHEHGPGHVDEQLRLHRRK